MRASVIVFPGSNCDRDMQTALTKLGGKVNMVWHGESSLPACDVIVVPGGFSYGDYLRSGAMAAHSPIMREVKKFAEKGGYVLGVCNGFQVLTEARMLPGVLMRNAGLKFICRDTLLRVESAGTTFTSLYHAGDVIRIPIAHHDGNYRIDDEGLKKLEANGQVAFRYVDEDGETTDAANPNGSIGNIAGVYSENKRVLGMMPHPERLFEPALGGTDGKALLEGVLKAA